MADVPKEAESKTLNCCSAMTQTVEYARTHDEKRLRPRPLAGLQFAHVFDMDGKYAYSLLAYVLPARGQGKARTQPANIVVGFCPFCGRKVER